MNAINNRIKVFLEEQNVSLGLLAKHIDYSIEEIEHALSDQTAEMRLVEQISKNFRIPLYSFFSDNNLHESYVYQPTRKVSNEVQALKLQLSASQIEILRLKQKLREQQLIIEKLQNMS